MSVYFVPDSTDLSKKVSAAYDYWNPTAAPMCGTDYSDGSTCAQFSPDPSLAFCGPAAWTCP